MTTPEINFQFAQPEHLPAIIDLLDAEGMRDLRRDTVPKLTETIENRPDAIIVGTQEDQEVVVSMYVGDILPFFPPLLCDPIVADADTRRQLWISARQC